MTAPSVALTSLADAVGLVATVGPGLAATDVLVEVALDESAGLRIHISTPDPAVHDLADVLQLRPVPGRGWAGTYPLTAAARRPLHIELELVDPAPWVLITMREALDVLDVLAHGSAVEISASRVRVQVLEAGGSQVEIHTTDPRDAESLQHDLVGIVLPAVVLAPDRTLPQPSPQGSAP
jgi:hypothetical protein